MLLKISILCVFGRLEHLCHASHNYLPGRIPYVFKRLVTSGFKGGLAFDIT